MKQILFSFFLLFCMAMGDFKANAQEVFAPIGAEWWYYNWRTNTIYSQHEAFYHYRSVKDTIVMEQHCRKISSTAYMRDWFPPSSPRYDTVTLRDLYIYDNTDTVFIFNESFNRFTPLYVLNANEGDTICLPVLPDIIHNEADTRTHPLTDDRSFCFVVDSVRTKTYDTTSLKTFYCHYITNLGRMFTDDAPVYNWSNYYYQEAIAGAYAEKIGGKGAGLLPAAIEEWVERPASHSYLVNNQTSFRCYSDSIINIKVVSGSCDSLYPIPVSISAQQSLIESVTIYPNPAREKVTIESTQAFPANTMVVVTDIAGKTVKTQRAGTGKTTITMELDNVQAGIYLLRIDAEKYSVIHKLVIYH